MMNRFSLGAMALSMAMLIPGAVSAHVGLEKPEATLGAPYKAVFKVPHGCNGSPTSSITIEIPEGVIGVKPMPKPGWTLATERGAYRNEYAFYHGRKVSEGVRKVTWTGGPLLDEHYDEFVLSSFIAGELAAGTVSFPVIQGCEKGELKWVEVAAPGQDPHDLKAPAPTLKLIAAGSDHGGGDHHHAATTEAKIGDLVIEKPWSRATPPGVKVAAGYMTIRNTGATADTLLGGSASFADRIEVHESSEKDGVASMRKLDQGLEIPAHGSVELKPGGLHLMLIGLKGALKAGDPVQLVLNFEKAGAVTVELSVSPLGAGNHDAGHKHDHH